MRRWYNENKLLTVVVAAVIVAAIALAVILVVTNQEDSKGGPSIYSVQEVERQLNDSAVRNNPDVKIFRTECIENAHNEFRCVVLFQDRKTNEGGFSHVLIRYKDDGTGKIIPIEGPAGMAPAA